MVLSKFNHIFDKIPIRITGKRQVQTKAKKYIILKDHVLKPTKYFFHKEEL